jgi:Skp1 family, tetramerisation domain
MCSEDSVTLVSNDGERFTVPKRVARMSELVLTVTEDEGALLSSFRFDLKFR